MRTLKLVLFAALVAGGWQLWNQREVVVSAYTEERDPLSLELGGVSAVPIASERSPSPYGLVSAGLDRAPTFLPPAEADEDEEPPVVQLTGGTVTLDGVVQLPDGTPVAGATVRIERFTTEGEAVGETISDEEGNWEAPGLRAGRLRVRAFAPNLLASVDPVVFVLSHTGSATLVLQVQQAAPSVTYELVGPPAIAIGTEATVAVVVARESVDENGRLVQVPIAGQPMLAAVDAPSRLLSADLLDTDAGGAARYLVTCDAEGTAAVNVLFGSARSALALPPCLTVEAMAELEAAAAAEDESAADAAEGDR